MAGLRKALIVATDQYADARLTRLNAPATDALELADVLRDAHVGAFEVETALNKPCQDVEIAIANFFASGARGDTLLIHFSCHGVKDLSGELYFACTDTQLPLLKVTGVSSSMVREAMADSRASLILCLVDCCYSGAFTKATKAAVTDELTARLGGQGRAVITASTSMQLALDGEEEPSLFTRAVLDGLRTGEADRDLDGLVTLDEFYSYVHERVTSQNPDQTPVKSFDVLGEVYLARRPERITTPAPLPRQLLDTLEDGEDWQRRGVVAKLAELLAGSHPGRSVAARQALERVRDNDDSIKVREAAAAALEKAGAGSGAIPEIPDYAEELQFKGAVDLEPDAAPEPAVDPTDGRDAEDDLVPELDTDSEVDTVPEVDEGPEEARVSDVDGEADVDGGTDVDRGIDVDDGTDLDRDDRTSDWRDRALSVLRRPWALAAVAAALVLAVVVTWAVVRPDDGGDDGGDGGERPSSALRNSEMLVSLAVENQGPQLVAVDIETGATRVLVDGGRLPTISHDREGMVYLRRDPEGRQMPYRALVDGSEQRALLRGQARSDCPFSSRAAQSPGSDRIALVCRNESSTALGLFVTDLDGEQADALYESSQVLDAPTWTDDETIVFVEYSESGTTKLSAVPAAGGQPEQVTDGSLGWDSHPDWSEAGLLFLRAPDDSEKGDVWVMSADGGETQLTTVGNASSPVWSPDGSQFAYLAPGGDGGTSIWIQDAVRGAVATEVEIDAAGLPGPPAWGSR